MEKLRFAVIGCGSLAQQMHIPNIARSRRASLYLCCDSSEEALAACRDKFQLNRLCADWREAVRDSNVEAICLATTEKLRQPVIELAAELGKPVYVEKPLAASREEMYAIQRIVHEAKIPVCVGHNRRCSPAMRDAHRLFRAQMDSPKRAPWVWDREGARRPKLGEEGTPSISVRSNDDFHSWKAWVYDKHHAPDGPMLFEMTHFTDICNWFLASPPVEVMALESGMYNHAAIVRYQNGALATINMCASGTFAYPKELYELMGNGCFVAIDHMVEVRTAGIDGAPARLIYPMLDDHFPHVGAEGGLAGLLAKRKAACEQAVTAGSAMRPPFAEADKGHAHAIDRFVEEIKGEGPVVCGVDDAVAATRVSFAAVCSAREGRPVALAEV